MASKSAAAGRSQQHGQSSREGKMRRSAIPCCLGLQKTILVGLRTSCVQLFLQSAFQGSTGPRGFLQRLGGHCEDVGEQGLYVWLLVILRRALLFGKQFQAIIVSPVV